MNATNEKVGIERSVYIEMRKMGSKDSQAGTSATRDMVSILIKSEPTNKNYKIALEELSKVYGKSPATMTKNMGRALECALANGNIDYIADVVGNCALGEKFTTRDFVIGLASAKMFRFDISHENTYNFRKIVKTELDKATFHTMEIVYGILRYLDSTERGVIA